MRTNRGITIIELIVVTSLLSFFASIIFSGVTFALVETRNVKRINDVNQYIRALELANDNQTGYPDPGRHSQTGENLWACLGDYPDDTCWYDDQAEMSHINKTISPYIPAMPINGYVGLWEGMIFRCVERSGNRCINYQIKWLMEGENESCGHGARLDGYSTGGNTYCSYCQNSALNICKT
jgi:type II secretory pathway pseudopilin PulG